VDLTNAKRRFLDVKLTIRRKSLTISDGERSPLTVVTASATGIETVTAIETIAIVIGTAIEIGTETEEIVVGHATEIGIAIVEVAVIENAGLAHAVARGDEGKQDAVR